ncbi:MAG: hypothetical protein IMZ61_09145 [Planctomycetes bacterium]|nr:hypothetical protein [Planctomycetota bacterium]
MKYTIEGRQTILDVVEADDRVEALKKFHAQYPTVNEIISVQEGNKPRKRKARSVTRHDSEWHDPKGFLYNPKWDERSIQ